MTTRNCKTLDQPVNGNGVYSLATSGEKLGISSANTYTLDRFLSSSSYNLYLTWDMSLAVDSQITKDASVPSFRPGDSRLRYLSKTQGDTSMGIIVFLPNPHKTDKFMIVSPPFSTTQVLSANPTANYFTKTDYFVPTSLINTVFYNSITTGYLIFGYGSLYIPTNTYYGVPATNVVTYSPGPSFPNEYFFITEITDTTIKCKYTWMLNPTSKYVDEIVIDISELPIRISVQNDNRFVYKTQIKTTEIPLNTPVIPPPITIISPPAQQIKITAGVYSTTDAKNLEIFTFNKDGVTIDFMNVTLPQAALTARSYRIIGEQIDFGLFWPGIKIIGKYLSPTSFTWNGSTFGPIITDLFGDWLMLISYMTYSTAFTIVSQSFSSWAARYSNSNFDNFYISVYPSNTSRFTISDAPDSNGGVDVFWNSTSTGMLTIGTLNDKKNIITGTMANVPSATFTLTRNYGQFNPAGKTFFYDINSTLTMEFKDNSNGLYTYNDRYIGDEGMRYFTYKLDGNQLVTGQELPIVNTSVFKISENELVSTGYVTIRLVKV